MAKGIRFKFKGQIEDIDLGFNGVMNVFNFLGGKQHDMEVGLFNKEAAEKGWINETHPRYPRPWFSATVEFRQEAWFDQMQESFRQELDRQRRTRRKSKSKRYSPGNRIRQATADLMVQDFRDAIEQRMYWTDIEPGLFNNAETTIKKKGFDHALVETKQMVNSLRAQFKGRK